MPGLLTGIKCYMVSQRINLPVNLSSTIFLFSIKAGLFHHNLRAIYHAFFSHIENRLAHSKHPTHLYNAETTFHSLYSHCVERHKNVFFFHSFIGADGNKHIIFLRQQSPGPCWATMGLTQDSESVPGAQA